MARPVGLQAGPILLHSRLMIVVLLLLLTLLYGPSTAAAVGVGAESRPCPAALEGGGGSRGGSARLPDGAFVRREGARFVLGGRPFAFVGANIDPLHGERSRGARCALLRALRHDGMSVARVWALGEGMPDDNPWVRRHVLLRAGPTGFIEDAYRELDDTLAAAREEGVRLILTLSNHWPDYGGVPMYLRWAGLSVEGLGFEDFYRDPRTRGYFRDHLARLLTRVNHRTGVRYVDDPTIFSWELMNESVVRSDEGAADRRAWVKEMAGLIRSYDKNHMIAAGLLGYDSLWERAQWVAAQALPEIDYCDSHLYPQLTGYRMSWARLRDLLDDRAMLARQVLRKPLVLGEFGFRTDGARTLWGAPRAAWFGRVVDQLLRDGAGGVLVWIYEPYSGKPRDFGIYIDRASTEDVRVALRRRGLALRARGDRPPPLDNPRLLAVAAASAGDAALPPPLYAPRLSLRNDTVHRGWRAERDGSLRLWIRPAGFALLHFERGGAWAPEPGAKGQGLPHAYGADSGRIEYRFTAAPPGRRGAPVELRLQARLSSEWPGAGAPLSGGSAVRVLLDGVELGWLAAVADDGVGRVERLATVDPALLRRVRAPGVHTLTFEVPEGPAARGLCIYGSPPAGAGGDPGWTAGAGDRIGPIELHLVPAAEG